MKKVMMFAAAAVAASLAAEELDIADQMITGTGPIAYESTTAVTSIRSSAFADNRAIETIRLGSVTKVGLTAFRGCSSLKELYLPSLRDFRGLSGSFTGCQNLIYVDLSAVAFSDDVRRAGFPFGAPNAYVRFRFSDGVRDRNGNLVE